MKRILYILALLLSIVACSEEIDKSNRYTFTGETVADFILNRSKDFSHFATLLERAKLLNLLSTYGRFTLFLPDNYAVEKFVEEQDSIYHATKDSENPVWTGITSPLVDELSDSMVNVIARSHVIGTMCRMAEMGEGSLASRNFNNHFLGVNYVVKDERYYIMLNNNSAIVDGDNEVENGIIHIVDRVIPPSQKNVPELINSCYFFKIFSSALRMTGFGDSLRLDNDKNYRPDKYTIQDVIGNYIYSPQTRYYKYTAFVESDDVFKSNGINDLNDLVALARKWYGTEDADNYRSPRNALHKFVAYHFVPRELSYNTIVPHGFKLMGFDIDKVMPNTFDRYDYFETMLGTMMKVVKPLSKPVGRDTYINYSKLETPYNYEMYKHLDVRVIPLTEFLSMKLEYSLFNQIASNGIVHPIDKILIYNENEMYGNILNERIRIDALNLIPELSCNGVRYNSNEKFLIPDEYSSAIKIDKGDVTTGYFLHYAAYNCDIINFDGLFDVEFTLPPLPARVYEVRLGLYRAGTLHSLIPVPLYQIQMYIDNKPEGRPFNAYFTDTAPNIQEPTGFEADSETYDNGVENDKVMRNRGWMKGPLSFCAFDGVASRHKKGYLRKIVGRRYFDSGRHKIRFRYVGRYNCSFNLDYIEFVPLHIISDPTKPEDRY